MRKLPGIIGKSSSWVALLLLFLSPLLLSSHASAQIYSYTDIHPPGWIDSRVTRINGSGEVVGFGTTSSGERGFLWSSGKVTEILPPGADSARAMWINDSGEVAGTWVKDGVRRAFLLRGQTYLDPTPGWGYSEATYMGEDGAVGGTGEYGAFVSRDGAVEIFPGFSVLVAGNSSGQFVGNGDDTARLYLPDQGYRDLTPPGTSSAAPRGINENGRVAVNSLQAGFARGFVFSDPFFVSMTPPGWTSSRVTAINNLEVVAGHGDSPEGRRSFLRSGGMYEMLSVPGWTATEAAAINDSGQVAGAGTTASGETHAFVASPPGAAAASSPVPGTSGGCAMAPQDAGGKTAGSAAASLMALVFPLLLLRGQARSRPATPR
ncbi:MAG: hypothetical protein OEM42_00530 [Deltaproteobacteria bacterium]|nr:hypothetical protein [Deltaproteobacteria bacterium]MDH3382525.1 hypothetical protein [Deltaproteobacteria bacterium]